MKALVAGLILLGTSFAFAQPDPRDSIILDYKTVTPSIGPAILTIRVWITNKDSLSGLILPLVESSFSGGAYATLSYPRTFSGVITPLTGSFTSGTADFSFYHSDSPDTFLLSGSASSPEPPHSTRQAVWEIKFDTVKNNLGCFELDSITFPPNFAVGFIDQIGRSVAVNFIKSRIRVDVPPGCCHWGDCDILSQFGIQVGAGDTAYYDFDDPCEGEWTFSVVSGPGAIDSITGQYSVSGQCQGDTIPVVVLQAKVSGLHCQCDSIKQCFFEIRVVPTKGDLNCDFSLSPADVVWILNCVMLGMAPPTGMVACDLNCDGQASPADVVLELKAVFLGQPFPC